VKPIHTKQRIIGLLGGSFNPAHEGHLHITQHALKKLRLDQVWWLVSPGNPLKSKDSMASYKERFVSAREMAAGHSRIHVSDIEARFNMRYSYRTLELLKRRYPGTCFIWLMGADNLAQFHRWRRWQQIINMLPIVVFDRVPFSHTALRSPAGRYLGKYLLKNSRIDCASAAPSLHFIHLRRDPSSSTHIRKLLGNGAFLRHNKNAGRDKAPAMKGERP
jgi:nicotinate-nucleotide adenylyltransferase